MQMIAFDYVEKGKVIQPLFQYSLIVFCHIDCSSDITGVIDCARTEKMDYFMVFL